jgi:hypothetical protein
MSRLLYRLSYPAVVSPTGSRSGNGLSGPHIPPMRGGIRGGDRAPMRNRTADLLLTMETLCLLSYRGARMPRDGRHQRTKIHTGRRTGRIQQGLHIAEPSGVSRDDRRLEIRRTLVSSTLLALPDMVRFMNPPVPAGVDGKASDALLTLGRFFTRWEESDDGRVAFRKGGRRADVFYRDRWSHDKVCGPPTV